MDTAMTIVSGTRVHRPLIDETVTTEDWEKARTELNETPEVREERLTIFKEMLSERADFTYRTDDAYLLRFLRVKKFNVELAYNMMRDHYKFRKENPKWFPVPSGIRRALTANIFNYLPHRDHMGRAIFLVKIGNWNSSAISYTDFVAAGNIMSECVLDNPVTQINGYIGIWDFSNFGIWQGTSFCLPSNVNLLITLIQNCFPGRLKVAYCINCLSVFDYAWKIFRRLLAGKYRNRVQILPSYEALHQYVDPCILPTEYRGNMPEWPCDEIVRLVMDNEQYFKDNANFGF